MRRGGFYKLFEHSSHQLVPQIINNGEHFNLFVVKSALSGSFCHSCRSCSPLRFLHDWQKYLGSTPISRQSEFKEPTWIFFLKMKGFLSIFCTFARKKFYRDEKTLYNGFRAFGNGGTSSINRAHSGGALG
jgi:hypothetical protein